MKKYISLFIVLLMVLGISIKANAEDRRELNDVRQEKPILVDENGKLLPPKERPVPTLFNIERDKLKLKREEVKTEIKNTREGLKTENEEKREAMKQEFEQKREEMKQQFEQKREEMKKEREEMREEGKAKIEALRENFKNEKDETKAKIKEVRITGRLNAFERFTNVEKRIAELRDRINASILKLGDKGVDTTKAVELVVKAETALAGINAKITEANALLSASTEQLTAETKVSLVKITKELQVLIKTAHQSLIDATKSLKDSMKVKIEADRAAAVPTPTEETN